MNGFLKFLRSLLVCSPETADLQAADYPGCGFLRYECCPGPQVNIEQESQASCDDPHGLVVICGDPIHWGHGCHLSSVVLRAS